MLEEVLTKFADMEKRLVALEAQEAGGSLIVNTDDVSNPPTDAELDTALGTPATVGAGFMVLVNDNAAGSNVYLVASDGSKWWYEALTAAV